MSIFFSAHFFLRHLAHRRPYVYASSGKHDPPPRPPIAHVPRDFQFETSLNQSVPFFIECFSIAINSSCFFALVVLSLLFRQVPLSPDGAVLQGIAQPRSCRGTPSACNFKFFLRGNIKFLSPAIHSSRNFNLQIPRSHNSPFLGFQISVPGGFGFQISNSSAQPFSLPEPHYKISHTTCVLILTVCSHLILLTTVLLGVKGLSLIGRSPLSKTIKGIYTANQFTGKPQTHQHPGFFIIVHSGSSPLGITKELFHAVCFRPFIDYLK